MGVKERVVAQLRRGEWEGLAREAGQDARVRRVLVGRLWDPDPTLAAGAAQAVGFLAARWPERGTELARRFLWALNEESGTDGRAVLPALASMAANAPAVVGPFTGALVAHLADEGMRAGLVRVLAALQRTAPAFVAPHLEDLAGWGVRLEEEPPLGGEEAKG